SGLSRSHRSGLTRTVPARDQPSDPADQHEDASGQGEIDARLCGGLDESLLFLLLQRLFRARVRYVALVADLVRHRVADEVLREADGTNENGEQAAEDRDDAHAVPGAPAAKSLETEAQQDP